MKCVNCGVKLHGMRVAYWPDHCDKCIRAIQKAKGIKKLDSFK